jgi:hypothetical protein
VQAVTRVNAEQASKRTMHRPTRLPFRGRLIRLGEVSKAIRSAAVPGYDFPSWQNFIKASQPYHAALIGAGVKADWIDLPALGIKGNSHMMMMDRNSDQIAVR